MQRVAWLPSSTFWLSVLLQSSPKLISTLFSLLSFFLTFSQNLHLLKAFFFLISENFISLVFLIPQKPTLLKTLFQFFLFLQASTNSTAYRSASTSFSTSTTTMARWSHPCHTFQHAAHLESCPPLLKKKSNAQLSQVVRNTPWSTRGVYNKSIEFFKNKK